MRDGPYLLVVLFLVSVVLSVIFWVAWRTLGRPRHARTWSIAFAIGALGYVLNAIGAVLRLHSPGYVIFISTPTILISVFGTLGYRQRAGLPLFPARFLAAIAAVASVMVVFNYIVPHQGLRLAVIPFFGGLMLLVAARAALPPDRAPNASERTAALFQVLFAFYEFLLAALALRLGRGPNPAALLLYDQTLLLGLPSCYIANGLIALFLLAADLARRMEHLAETDTLTSLLNRRGFEREAAAAILRARARGTSLAAVISDIDHFKKINDQHGHAIGDLALRRFADYLRSCLSVPHLLGRLGGEEFVLLLIDTSESAAVTLIDRLRSGVSSIRLSDRESDPIVSFTASFGITTLQPDDASLADLLPRADTALYAAKDAGRNRVCLFDPHQFYPALRPSRHDRVSQEATN